MKHVALPLKYRPMTFDDVVGQEHVVKTVRHAIESGRIANAYLFIGPRGIGKTTLSRIFAKALNCQEPAGVEPCGKCVNCEEIAAGRSLDVTELDAASHNKVEDVKPIIDAVQFKPTSSKYKIFIVDECHMLTNAAWNALLKTLEEPPAHAVFIMTCPSASCLLETVRSRSQTFSLGDATDVSSSQDDESICPVALNLAQLLCEGNEAAFMWETAAFEKDKQLFTDALAGLGICLRDAIVLKNGGNVIMGDKDTAVLLSRTFSAFVLTNMAQRVTALTAQLKSNINNNLAITRLSSELFGAKLS